MGENSEASVQPPPPVEKVNRATFIKRAGAVIAGLGLFGASGVKEAQAAQSLPKPEEKKPDSMFPNVQPTIIKSVQSSSVNESSRKPSLITAEVAANRELFSRSVDELVSSVQKGLPVNTLKIKTTYQTGAKDNLAYPTVESKANLTPEIQIFTQDEKKETIDTALLLTGDAVGHVLDQAFDGKFSAQMTDVYHNVMSGFNDKERDAAFKLLDTAAYVDGPKVETQDSTDDTASWAYARSFSLLRLKSEQVVKKLTDPQTPPAVREGMALVLLTALKSTTTRLSGPIPPRELGFNEAHIKELVKISGNKVSIGGMLNN